MTVRAAQAQVARPVVVPVAVDVVDVERERTAEPWLDDDNVLYGVPRDGGRSDVWVSPLAGGTPRIVVPDAESPAVVRP